ncbi:MAG: UDP-N-acetylmuramate dehydrogenase [Clostridia bacterium]|nr:UDP-N-acetylmuramate dehydrogenase [Clostridia bacterium]
MERAELANMLRENGCRVQEQELLSAHTTFRIGGAAELFVTASTAEQAAQVLRLCRGTETPLLLLGNGSNLLVSDDGVDGVVLRLAASTPGWTVSGTTVTVDAGVTLSKLCIALGEAGLSGLEFAYGIPGTVGGGVYMNAGAYGGQLSDVISSVTALAPHGEIVVLGKDELEFGYRHSVFMKNGMTVWSVTMELAAGEPTAIRAAMAEYLARRRDKQPLEYPSAGSFFKRPEGHFAGALIEQCGLKGFTVGGAQVSEKHAGFVINRGGATCADVMALGDEVARRVKDTFGVELEREVQFVGR